MNVLYTGTATSTSGRDGRVSTDDGKIDLVLSVPEGLGGAGGSGTNPEQLFAAAYAACFGGALKLVAGQQKIATGPVTITARASLGKSDSGFAIAVELIGNIPQLPADEVMRLMRAAHEVCPYSNATRNNVDVKLSAAS